MGKIEQEPALVELCVDYSRAKEPLRECVRDSLDNYLAQLKGHRVTDLYELVMKQVEVPLLETVLRHTHGNQSKAAKVLGISRGTLRKKLKHYEIE